MTTPVKTVSISGTAQVGQTLTAIVDPSEATAAYKWKQSNAQNGQYTDIPGANSKTYLLTSAEQSKYIKVEVTGTGAYTGTQTSAATVQVQAAAAPMAAKASNSKRKV